MAVDSCNEDMDYEKLQALVESNSVKPTSGHNNVERFGEVALEAAKNFLEDKVIDEFVDNTVCLYD